MDTIEPEYTDADLDLYQRMYRHLQGFSERRLRYRLVTSRYTDYEDAIRKLDRDETHTRRMLEKLRERIPQIVRLRLEHEAHRAIRHGY